MLLPSLTLFLTTAAFAAAQLVFPNLDLDHDRDRDRQLSAAVLMDQTQTHHDDKPDSQPIDYDELIRAPRLSDVMTLEPQASIFFSYARESAKFSEILSGETESGDEDGHGHGHGEKKYTVFAPMNRAVMALPRKPHQGRPQNVEIPVEITQQEADRQSLLNVERWVGAHIVPGDLSDAASLTGSHATLFDQQSITFSHPEGKDGWKGVVLEPGKATIVGRREAANGILYLVDGTVEIDV